LLGLKQAKSLRKLIVAGGEIEIMVKLKSKSQSDRETTDVSYHNFRHKNLLLFILASLFIHSLGLLLFGFYQHRHLVNKEKIDSKPIEFVVIPPEKTQDKPPPETQKRAVENSVAEKTTEPKETLATEELAEKIPPRPTPPPAPKIASPPPTPPQAAAPPKPIPPTPPQAAAPPKAPPKPTPPVKSQPTPSPAENQPPVLSGSDPASVTTPKPQPAQKDNPVATRLPPDNNQPSESLPESAPSQPNTTSSEQRTTGDAGAAGLLGGDYQKTLADGGNDAFFSPEALAYEKVLNPDQINALKDIDLSQYFAEIKRRVKSNWQPSYAVEEYTTFLTFEIQKNGQVTGLRVTQSSGSEQVDRESLAAVQNSAPFSPLPPEFPLEALDVEFSFNIYIY
jgi:periplasmic protein TonB